MMIGWRVMGDSRGDKITRHHLVLVNQLIKRVLTVGAGSPQIIGPVW